MNPFKGFGRKQKPTVEDVIRTMFSHGMVFHHALVTVLGTDDSEEIAKIMFEAAIAVNGMSHEQLGELQLKAAKTMSLMNSLAAERITKAE